MERCVVKRFDRGAAEIAVLERGLRQVRAVPGQREIIRQVYHLEGLAYACELLNEWGARLHPDDVWRADLAA